MVKSAKTEKIKYKNEYSHKEANMTVKELRETCIRIYEEDMYSYPMETPETKATKVSDHLIDLYIKSNLPAGYVLIPSKPNWNDYSCRIRHEDKEVYVSTDTYGEDYGMNLNNILYRDESNGDALASKNRFSRIEDLVANITRLI